MMKFFVKGQRIEVTEREVIASGQIAFVTLKFTFDCSWNNLHKVVQFSQYDEVYNRVLGVDGLSCLLPSELHPGMVKMSVFGYDSKSDTTVHATTVLVTLHVKSSGFDGESCNVPPTPDLYAQLLAEMKKLLSEMQNGSNGTNGKDGENGLSAYKLEVQNRFTGTLTEWLNSLKGADGKDGADGNSPEVSGFATTEYVEECLSEILVILENLPTASTITLFSYGEDVPDKYGNNIFTIYQNDIQDLSGYIRNNKPFCNESNGYILNYSQVDFGWDGFVCTGSTTPINVDSQTAIAMCYQSGCT